MEKSTTEALSVGAELIIAAILITAAVLFTVLIQDARSIRAADAAAVTALTVNREWEKYTGDVTGADIIDFIQRNRDSGYDIVIRRASWSAAASAYLQNGAFVIGFSGNSGMPDYVWDADYLFLEVLGSGSGSYTARLLYDGALISGDGDTITGIEYSEVW